MRGHGQSEKLAPPYAWRNFATEVVEVSRHLGFRDVLAVGHSKGGYAITLAAAIDSTLFGKLLLFDPVILPKDAYLTLREGEHFAARRRNRWASAEKMYERFANRPPFNAWDPATLKDYCQYGLLPAADGEGFVLACPPEIEAATYAASGGEAIYKQIASVRIPVRVMRAKGRMDPAQTDMSSSPTAPDLASHFLHGLDVPLPQYSHFIPMEAPDLVAGYIREMAASAFAPR